MTVFVRTPVVLVCEGGCPYRCVRGCTWASVCVVPVVSRVLLRGGVGGYRVGTSYKREEESTDPVGGRGSRTKVRVE